MLRKFRRRTCDVIKTKIEMNLKLRILREIDFSDWRMKV